MKRKIFISINLAERDKKRLIRVTEKWQDSSPHQKTGVDTLSEKQNNFWCGGLPVKWVKESNLHITLVFLGHIMDESIAEICGKVREAVKDVEIFDLELEAIELGPDAENPKMIWLSGRADENLKSLHEKIERALGIFVSSKKSFRPHITLGKIRGRKWEALAPKPEIFEKYNLIVPVEAVDIMASDFSDGGREYTIIESCPLK